MIQRYSEIKDSWREAVSPPGIKTLNYKALIVGCLPSEHLLIYKTLHIYNEKLRATKPTTT